MQLTVISEVLVVNMNSALRGTKENLLACAVGSSPLSLFELEARMNEDEQSKKTDELRKRRGNCEKQSC